MKTSLVCLLLLAAVACAAPKAGEAEMARMAEEAGEVGAVADTELQAKAGGKRESRFFFGSPCYGPCYDPYGQFLGCYFDGCYDYYDYIFSDGYCVCCAVSSSAQC